jgi:tRNA/tmRNA/rRNA uracil-C5-methylase (TrmA/RlmC/RlmD family)
MDKSKPCKPGKERNANGRCVKIKSIVDSVKSNSSKTIKLKPCKPGKERNANGRCVKIKTTASKKTNKNKNKTKKKKIKLVVVTKNTPSPMSSPSKSELSELSIKNNSPSSRKDLREKSKTKSPSPKRDFIISPQIINNEQPCVSNIPCDLQTTSPDKQTSHSKYDSPSPSLNDESREIFIGHGKVDFFFRNVPTAIRNKIKLDQEALYSVTDSETADKMTSIISRLPGVSRSSTITDLTACVGGNVVSFARVFRNVNAVEIDPVRFKLLKYNVSEILGDENNVVFRQGDAIEEAVLLRQDVIFIDPPWGGTDYMKCCDPLNLYLSGRNIGELCENVFGKHARHVAIKVPVNFDVNHFKKQISVPVQVRRDFRKMILLLIDYGENRR